MKKRLWTGLAVCSLAIMTACGNDAKETAAAAPAQAAAEQPAERAVEAEASQAEAAVEVEHEAAAETEAAVETAAERSGPSDTRSESLVLTEGDIQLVEEYFEQIEPALNVAQSTMSNLYGSLEAWNNYEMEDAELRESLMASNAAFTLLEYDFSRIQVPGLESAAVYEVLSEIQNIFLGMGINGGRGVDLFIEGLDTQNEAKLDEANEAFAPFEQYEKRMAEISKEVQMMLDTE
ncbi:hypothetical protein [Saccharibacillus brassicae]|uniref:Lipoprotein n=1 Tax=Saccharibacillus brassicae TaxID=2583377 RepID=A0A4Y6UVP2_SACBS|nr:hypothetical protein [Saccharibacillus brassicae]QDH20327.1 hypothetical protein FFV09_05305 [Saccharibacillus brassicae]